MIYLTHELHRFIFWRGIWNIRDTNTALIGLLFYGVDVHCKECPYLELFWSTFFLHFPTFGLNTERYYVSLRIQYECGKMRENCGPD